ncbi:MAG: hypothetical protein LBR29_03460 [Methylobacteriaceae bacterium]|jgi:Flp pilus assembly protein protease CpaA|nr:hypothetical protein [Methylobacteriaceae bacterium]
MTHALYLIYAFYGVLALVALFNILYLNISHILLAALILLTVAACWLFPSTRILIIPNAATAFGVLVIGLAAFALSGAAVGAGVIKLLVVLALWYGPSTTLIFCIAVAIPVIIGLYVLGRSVINLFVRIVGTDRAPKGLSAMAVGKALPVGAALAIAAILTLHETAAYQIVMSQGA